MATPTGEVKTVLTYGDMKQTWEGLPARPLIDPEILEAWRISTRRMYEFAEAFYNLQMPVGWCMPSREGVFTGLDNARIHDHPLNPVEEDSVFAPREVEVVCGNSS